MILETLKQFNWLDIVVVILLLRICYVGIKSGFLVELFKILGTIFSIYLSFHYFPGLSYFINSHIPSNFMPAEFLDFICFVLLATIGYLVFVILRHIILHFIKMEAIPKLSRWGGFILAAGRAFLYTSLIIFMLVISTIAVLKRSVVISYSGKYLFSIAPAVYSGLWDGFASKFATNEKVNQDVLDMRLSDSANE